MKTDDSSYLDEGIKDRAFSWDEKGELIQDFLAFIKKWWWLYSNFPFVDQIFLANSLCFNALKARSDIDFLLLHRSEEFGQQGFLWVFWCGVLVLKGRKNVNLKDFVWVFSLMRIIFVLSICF